MLSSLLEVDFQDTVTVQPVVFIPDERSVVLERWTFCPISLGAELGYQCVLEACNVELTSSEVGGSVTFSPGAQAIACITALSELQGGSEPEGSVDANEGLPDVVNTVLSYDIVSDEDTTLTTVLEIPLWLGEAPTERNVPPALVSVSINGELLSPSGGVVTAPRLEDIELSVVVDESSLQPYVDNVGRDRVEEALVSFYATKGRFEVERRIGVDVTNTLSFYSENQAGELELLLPPEGLTDTDTSMTVYVVIRDGRGGQSVAGPYVVEFSGS